MSTLTTTVGSKSSVSKTVNKENKKNAPKNVTTESTPDSTTVNADGKLQPTAEQMRLANLMNDKTDFCELKTKVDKIIELTGSTRDEAIVALHDCDQNLEKAIDMVLEGDPINESEWKSSCKKKKPKVVASQQSQNESEEKVTVNGEKPKAPVRARGGPRLQKGNKKDSWRPKEEKNTFSNENDAHAADDFGSNQPPRRRDRDGDNRRDRDGENRRDNRDGESRRGRGRGQRGGNRGGGEKGSRGTRTFQNRGYRSNANDTFPNSIDTWTNSTADQSHTTTTVNNDCTTMTVGNWSDIAANEDWSEEDWDSNIMETKVFTSSKSLPEKDELPDIGKTSIKGSSSQNIALSSLLQKKNSEVDNQQNISSIMGSNSMNQTTPAGTALLQQLQQQQPQSVSQTSQMNPYGLSQYSKQATESIKSLVGIPSSSTYSTSANSGLLSSGSSLDNQGNNINQVRAQQGQPSDHGLVSAKPQRLTNKRSTKIPESAVEMPSNDSISSLNVQFGALEFGTDNYTLGADTSNAFHDAVNHVTTKSGKGVSGSASAAASLNTSLLDNAYRNTSNASESTTKSAASTDILQSSVLGNQSMSETVLDRNKQSNAPSSYGPKVLDSTQHKSSLYQSVSNQPQNTNVSDMSGYKNTAYTQPDASNMYGAGVNYGSGNAYIYPSTTNQGGYSAVNNYSSNFSTGTTTVPTGGPQQKVGLKELDSTNTQRYDAMQNVVAAGAASLGLVSNSTVTTNVLKNSLTATGKGIASVPPGVSPLMPQYIMGQPAFYPVYDVVPTATRDHNFAAYTASDVKYSRADNDGSNVVSTQAPVSQTHSQPIFGQFPPGYGFFYTPGAVNMMPQSLYGAAAPLFPMTPAGNAHASSASSAFPKGTTGYGSHSYASSAYDSIQQPDYVKQSYSAAQQSKGMTATNSELSNQMYSKSHAQLAKNYDKAGFQTGTPPPFNVAGPSAAMSAASYATQASPYAIQMLPPNQPSMLHQSLQADVGQSGTGGVGGPRSMSQSQKGSGANTAKYGYNSWA